MTEASRLLGPSIGDLAVALLERGGSKNFEQVVDHVLRELVRQTLERDPRFVRTSMGGWGLAKAIALAEKQRVEREREMNELAAAGPEPVDAPEAAGFQGVRF